MVDGNVKIMYNIVTIVIQYIVISGYLEIIVDRSTIF
jgi:hypothetical protein